MTKIEHHESSGNVFADLGFPDADTHLFKAQLVSTIAKLVKDQGLTQTVAAERIGMAQPDVSKMLKGQFRSISVERLLRCIMALGSSVEIKISHGDEVAALRISEVHRNSVMPTAHQCRWPIGDPQSPEFHFCNNKRAEGWPYCEHHVRNVAAPVRLDRLGDELANLPKSHGEPVARVGAPRPGTRVKARSDP